jgi:type IV pilus assembly protein PilC
MVGVIYFLLPKLESLFSAFKNTSSFTLFILGTASFIRANGIFILAGVIILIMIINRLLNTNRGKRFKDRVALAIPVMKNLNRNNILTTFSRSLGILLESGIPIQQAMSITSNTVGNSVYGKILDTVQKNIKIGKNLAYSMRLYPKYFPPTYVKMIEVGESTGSLEENLEYLYDFYAEEVEEMSNNLTTLLEPIMLIFVGLMIGALALIIIAPIYQLTGSIRAQ